MSRTNAFVTITAIMILAIMAVGFQRGPALAQTGTSDTEDFDVPWQLSGDIVSITPLNSSVYLVVLSTGETVKINPATQLPGALAVNDTITIIAVMDDDGFVAKVITMGTPEATGTATGPAATSTDLATSTAPATGTATATATSVATGTTVATTAAGCGSPNPVAIRLAAAFGVSPEEIMAKHCDGFGFGEIAKAYELAKLCKDSADPTACKSAADFLAMKKGGKGWGNIIKESGVDPRKLAPGQIMKGTAAADKPGKGNGKGGPKASAEAKGNGNGNGKGNGKGNGNGNGGK
jgi:hypothetical protein